MSWIYKKTYDGVWTVGFYEPDGNFIEVSDHYCDEAAADRCHYLNGGEERDKDNGR